MAILKLLFFYFFILPSMCGSSQDCQLSSCSNNQPVIRFPFRMQGMQNPTCGYHGFNLFCTNDNRTAMKLPHSEKFYVRNINYLSQNIQIYDPDDCLPRRLLSLNLSNSPFVATFRRNFTLISCPYQITDSQFTPIDCLSNSTNSISAVPSVMLASSLPESCFVISRVFVPVERPEQDEEDFTDDLGQDLRLTWYSPNCRDCESQQGVCGFESRNSNQIHCLSGNNTGHSQKGLQLFRIMVLAIACPAVVCVIGMACFACFVDGRSGIPQRTAPAVISTQPAATPVVGLDETTIESYQKLVLGESRRLPGPNDGSCAICLSEYNTKETVRCIPECKHCFHADCIDEWLRMNSTCPVCRNSPSPSPVHITSNGA